MTTQTEQTALDGHQADRIMVSFGPSETKKSN